MLGECVGGGDTEPSSSDYLQARVASIGVGGNGNSDHGYHYGGSCCRSQE